MTDQAGSPTGQELHTLLLCDNNSTRLLLQVYAPTIPGFGRSEKPALAYSQTLWLDFLREFVVEVVRRPVVVVGNSIGGFISASLAAACPTIVKGRMCCWVAYTDTAALLNTHHKVP